MDKDEMIMLVHNLRVYVLSRPYVDAAQEQEKTDALTGLLSLQTMIDDMPDLEEDEEA